MQSYAEKLATLQRLETKGVLGHTTIVAFRSDCPFCNAPSKIIIDMRSHNKGAGYACIACGESGHLSEIEENLSAANPPAFTFREHGKKKVKG